jgi:putative transposase
MRILHSIWLNEAKAWPVGDYLLMPDRMHFFCGLRDSRVTVEHWIAYWKDRFAKGHSQRTWAWQRGVFHHRVRSIQEYREKWIYIMENPVRKGLVTQWKDWPWRGRVHDFSW